jgi:hypothetical protein
VNKTVESEDKNNITVDLPKSHREVELKFPINTEQETILSEHLGKPDLTITGSDAFWDLKYPKTVAFLRFRQSADFEEWTVKVEDKGTPMDRVEDDLPTLMGVMEQPDFYLTKVVDIWKKWGVVMCSYYVAELDLKFFEIEGETMQECTDVWSQLNIATKVGLGGPSTDSLFTIGKKKLADGTLAVKREG